MEIKFRIDSSSPGFAALFVVVVVGAAALLMGRAAIMLGLGELEMGYVVQQGEEAFALADGCLEEAFLRLRRDSNYGVGLPGLILTTATGSCEVTISDLGASQRRVAVLGTANQYYQRLEAEITLSSGSISIDSWRERDD